MKSRILNIVIGVVITFLAMTLNRCNEAQPFVNDFCEQVMFINDAPIETVKIDTVYLEKIKLEKKYITFTKVDTFYKTKFDTVEKVSYLAPLYTKRYTTHHEGRNKDLKLLTFSEIYIHEDSVLNHDQIAEYEIRYNSINTITEPKAWSYSVGVTVPLTNTDNYIPMPTFAANYKNYSAGFSYDIPNSSFFGTVMYTFGGTKTTVNKIKNKINGKLD